MQRNPNRLSALKGSAAMLLTATFLGGIPVQTLAQSSNGFTSTDAEEEGYWYSRYNLGNLSMRSGLGNVVMPDKAVIMMAIAAVDADFNPAEMQAGNMAYGDGDHVTPPQMPPRFPRFIKAETRITSPSSTRQILAPSAGIKPKWTRR